MDPLNQTPNHQAPKDFWEDPEIKNFLTRLDCQIDTFDRFNIDLSGSYSLLLPTITKITVNLQKPSLFRDGAGRRPKALLTMLSTSDLSKKVQDCAESYLTGKGFEVVGKGSLEGQLK
ncbi:hypothetical protein [Estrella lausannensis]|uniref:Uncharacterized protein n=1 Tax=Estrella lausannensis TaxID=483423 RepID=A0A0H5E7Q3_9BACT|nr:hypothetical protein [Estrella lausannensis]CRX39365.1 hypothetical protein ELAC_2044 [Estrella lausannensis]